MEKVIENPLFTKAMEKLRKVEEKYLEKFGEHSLDRVILGDPLSGDKYPDMVWASVDKLEKAIKNNKPLDQIPEEMWKNLIF